VVAGGLMAASGGSGADPRTPPALAGLPAPFLGTAVVGSGGLAAAIDAYGDVVDMRAPGPAGAALIYNPAGRQAAGSVSPDTGIVPRLRIGGRPALAMWRAASVAQRYLPGTNVVRTVATFPLGARQGSVARVELTDAARGGTLARLVRVEGPPGVRLSPSLTLRVRGARCEQARRGRELGLICSTRNASSVASAGGRSASRDDVDARTRVFARAARIVDGAAIGDRRWLARARPLGSGAPPWARRMYRRSLLVLRALTDARTGALAAGIRDGWAYVWPRDAATAALALAASGYRPLARRIARFLLGLELGAAARFDGAGAPVPGRAAQGNAAGWVAVAARAAGLAPADSQATPTPWRDRADYQEGPPGNYLANAIAATGTPSTRAFETRHGLLRQAGDPASGLDSAAAWAVRPFPQPALFPLVRETLLHLARQQTRYGITPGEGWPDPDPWTAPTAWSAWSLAALGERRPALRLLADLRRAATSAGDLPERVGVRTGIPRSTTPLAWSHAFAILALRRFWPP
jgi:glucoamylase